MEIVAVLLAFIAGFFCALKAVQVGLKWQIQTKEGREPELKSPIAPIVEAKQQSKVDGINQYRSEQMQEWLFGKGGE